MSSHPRPCRSATAGQCAPINGSGKGPLLPLATTNTGRSGRSHLRTLIGIAPAVSIASQGRWRGCASGGSGTGARSPPVPARGVDLLHTDCLPGPHARPSIGSFSGWNRGSMISRVTPAAPRSPTLMGPNASAVAFSHPWTRGAAANACRDGRLGVWYCPCMRVAVGAA
jgi:hypothetical protein